MQNTYKTNRVYVGLVVFFLSFMSTGLAIAKILGHNSVDRVVGGLFSLIPPPAFLISSIIILILSILFCLTEVFTEFKSPD